MSHYLQNITIQAGISEYGDALIYGSKEAYGFVPAMYLKHLLFAWHEPSFYGTELEVEQTPEVELIILPAEQVISFFADQKLLHHVNWKWEGEAAQLHLLAPYLLSSLDNKKYMPSLNAYRRGKLQWKWDTEEVLKAAGRKRQKAEVQTILKEADSDFLQGLQAAYSAAVSERYYNDEAEAADLRREYPQLFDRNNSTAGLDENTWLVSIGWKSDMAPFRPALQLLEPEDTNSGWRLRLVLQDKADETHLVPVRLEMSGYAEGDWPDGWEHHVRDRSAGWREQLRAVLPVTQFATEQDMIGRTLNNEQAWRFLSQYSNRLLQSGWLVLLPAWWEAARRKRPKLKAKVSEEEEKRTGKSFFGLDALIDFDWRVSIGETELTEEEFAELAEKQERLALFRGQWIVLDPELLEQIRRAMNGIDRRRGLSFQDVLQLHLMRQSRAAKEEENEAEEEENQRIEIEVELNEHLAGLISQISQQNDMPLIPVPAALNAQLRPYQQEGFSWLSFLRRFGLGACLADDMGLGKTIQLITYLLHIKEDAASETLRLSRLLLETAEEDIQHSQLAAAADTVSDPMNRLDSANRINHAGATTMDNREQNDKADKEAAAILQVSPAVSNPTSLVVCPTSVLGNWQKEIMRFAPSLKVALHYGSKRLSSDNFHQLVSEHDVILTSYATASLDQSLLQEVTWATICLDEAQNIKNAQTRQSQTVRSLSALHRVALTGTPIENRLAELWSIYDFITPGYLGSMKGFQDRFAQAIEKEQDEQRTLDLQKLVKPFMLRRTKKDPNIQLNLPEKNEMKTYINLTPEQGVMYDQAVNQLMQHMNDLEGMKRKGAILSALTQLKQICDHPALLHTRAQTPDPEETEIPDVPEDLEALVSRSAKMERLLEMVRELRSKDEKCLIFTQYIGMGQIIQRVLSEDLDEPVLYLNGSTSKTARDRMIEQFQSPGEPNIFILSLKAGGVGLNLTAANHVFHVDRWWNPAVENQATDRAYRMGQTRDVQVHKFISLGTLEERIDEMLESKQQLSNNIISTSEGWITELSNDELQSLFSLRREWAEV
ncbi:DEAD/DEAH box helicase [Paenibacillus bovis]|uniref:Helicase n=1 Tax=Paenibacillus bovis TaxID=1616788 RepID=A0A172ZC83_9BACL|nr:DEAD/DEAH box helicase [Paenibacillus bovis]ANF95254.1 helicase [Paenibacillus bovis]